MRFPRRIAVLFLAHGLLLTSPAAQAGKVRQDPTPLPPYPVAHRARGVGCQIGQPGPGNFSIRWICPPDDRYLTLLQPSSCTDTCMGRNTVVLSAAHVRLFFTHPCTLQVAASIVGVTADTCGFRPDESNVLCQPTQAVIAMPDSNQTREFSIPLSQGCT